MNVQTQHLAFYLCASLAVLAAALFVWRNMQPQYRHHRFFDKDAFGAYLLANTLVIGPVLLRMTQVGRDFPMTMTASQILGLVAYVLYAARNIRGTGWAMGLAGTLFQTVAFGALFGFVVVWMAGRFGIGALRVFGDMLGSQYTTYKDPVDLDESVYEEALREREIYYDLRPS